MSIHQINNFLEPDILESLRTKFKNSNVFEINYMGRWGSGLEKGSLSPVLILPLEEYKSYFIEKYNRIDPLFSEFKNLVCYMHIWLPGSQINWHHDGGQDNSRISSTIYINEYWDRNWGGLFLYHHDTLGQGWTFPVPNTCIWFIPPLWHGTSMVTQAAEFPRLSIQLFFNR